MSRTDASPRAAPSEIAANHDHWTEVSGLLASLYCIVDRLALLFSGRKFMPDGHLEAIVAIDLANSRMKDFYDLLAMPRLFAFKGATIAAAIRATFERCATATPRERPPPLTHAFSEDPRKFDHWRSFLARDPLLIDEPDLRTVIREVGDFITPTARAAIDDRRTPGRWTSDCC